MCNMQGLSTATSQPTMLSTLGGGSALSSTAAPTGDDLSAALTNSLERSAIGGGSKAATKDAFFGTKGGGDDGAAAGAMLLPALEAVLQSLVAIGEQITLLLQSLGTSGGGKPVPQKDGPAQKDMHQHASTTGGGLELGSTTAVGSEQGSSDLTAAADAAPTGRRSALGDMMQAALGETRNNRSSAGSDAATTIGGGRTLNRLLVPDKSNDIGFSPKMPTLPGVPPVVQSPVQQDDRPAGGKGPGKDPIRQDDVVQQSPLQKPVSLNDLKVGGGKPIPGMPILPGGPSVIQNPIQDDRGGKGKPPVQQYDRGGKEKPPVRQDDVVQSPIQRDDIGQRPSKPSTPTKPSTPVVHLDGKGSSPVVQEPVQKPVQKPVVQNDVVQQTPPIKGGGAVTGDVKLSNDDARYQVRLTAGNGDYVEMWGDPHVVVKNGKQTEKFDIGYGPGAVALKDGTKVSWETFPKGHKVDGRNASHALAGFVIDSAGTSHDVAIRTDDKKSVTGVKTTLTEAQLDELSAELRLYKGPFDKPLTKQVTAGGADPVKQAPVQQTPAKQTPVQQTPVKQAPVQQTPVQQSTTVEQPVLAGGALDPASLAVPTSPAAAASVAPAGVELALDPAAVPTPAATVALATQPAAPVAPAAVDAVAGAEIVAG